MVKLKLYSSLTIFSSSRHSRVHRHLRLHPYSYFWQCKSLSKPICGASTQCAPSCIKKAIKLRIRIEERDWSIFQRNKSWYSWNDLKEWATKSWRRRWDSRMSCWGVITSQGKELDIRRSCGSCLIDKEQNNLYFWITLILALAILDSISFSLQSYFASQITKIRLIKLFLVNTYINAYIFF